MRKKVYFKMKIARSLTFVNNPICTIKTSYSEFV